MSTTADGIQELIDKARAQADGPRRVASTDVCNNSGTLYGAIDAQFADNIDLEAGDSIEKYVHESGRAMVMFFPEEDSDA